MVPMLNTKTVSNAWKNMFDALHKSCVEWMYKEWLYFLLSWCLILVSISLCIAPWPCGRMRKLKYPPPPTFSLVCVLVVWSMIFNNKDMESKDESYARWKELYLYIEKERNFCCCLDASCNKNYFRCMTQMFVHKRIRNTDHY